MIEAPTIFLFKEFVPLETKNTNSYGYGFGSNRHRSQLGVKITKPNNDNDLIFSVTGWDIDHIYETSVFLNDKVIGFLTKACRSCFNGGDKFVIESSQLQAGQNQLTFIQRSPDTEWNGFQDEKWSVTDLLIREKEQASFPCCNCYYLTMNNRIKKLRSFK